VARGAYRTDEVFSTCSSRNFPRLTSTNRSALWQDGGSKKMGWPAQALSGPVRAHLPPRGSSWHFGFSPWFVSFWGRHPRSQDRGSSRMKSELYVLLLGDDPSYHLGPCHLWKWFLLALKHERNSSFAPLNLLWLRPFCPCFPAKTQYFQIHIRSWTCYIISVPSGRLVANHNRNQCITSTLGWRKFTINIFPMLKTCSSSSK
jgi:hypothetical protein